MCQKWNVLFRHGCRLITWTGSGELCASNSSNCTPVAFCEKMEKFTPFASGVAPSGCAYPFSILYGAPSDPLVAVRPLVLFRTALVSVTADMLVFPSGSTRYA